jgi:hypothetical protein
MWGYRHGASSFGADRKYDVTDSLFAILQTSGLVLSAVYLAAVGRCCACTL